GAARALDIPARFVSGYVADTDDAPAYDSWAEAWDDGLGWIAFDPTPFAGRADYSLSGGLLGQVSRYLDALETFWIQYFVAFDNHEQRSLFRSIRDGFNDFQNSVSIQAEYLQARISEWWSAIRGDRGIEARLSAVKYGVVYVAGILIALFASTWLYKRLNLRDLAKRILMWLRRRKVRGIVEFYDRMTAVLSRRGLNRDPSQTPLEFAVAVGIPAVGVITDRYNRVRFGGADLTESESEEIERLIVSIEDQPHTSRRI
ncbi:MAG TPA: transglutaminase domain-containing protein, partial [Pyrinomonadaceae bacterium]|nr:transglutaminase domain-containing protein [Pyrinomonadaceae bacterium]